MGTTLASQRADFDDFGPHFGDLGRPLETSGDVWGSGVVFVSVLVGIGVSMGSLRWPSGGHLRGFVRCGRLDLAAQCLGDSVDAFVTKTDLRILGFCC